MKSFTLIVVVLPLVLSSCGSTTASAPTTTTSKSGLPPALQVHNPKVMVTPSRNLRNGEKVTVSVRGFGPEGKFFLSECAKPSEANGAGCGHQLAAQPFGITDSNGSGSFTFRVSRTAGVKPYNKARAQCTDQCVIVAGEGIGYGFAYEPIEFATG